MAAKRWTPAQRARVGALLTERREELDPRYYVREVFAAERGINLRMAADIEKGRPRNFTPLTMRDVVARAYAVEDQSIYAAADGGDLEAVPGSPPRRTAQPLVRTVPLPPSAGGEWLPPLTPDETAAARPHADEIWQRLRGLALRGIADPPGASLFPGSDDDARTWDDRTGALNWITVQQRVWLIAWNRAEAGSRRRTAGSG